MSDGHESDEQEIPDDQNYNIENNYYKYGSTNSEDDAVKLFIGQVKQTLLFSSLLSFSLPFFLLFFSYFNLF